MNEIFNEDCVLTMERIDAGSLDLVITSPPYDSLRNYHGFSFDFHSIATGLFRVLKVGGVCVWVVGDSVVKGSETGTFFRQALFFMETGFRLHDTMIYAKKNYIPLTHNRYEQAFEYMFVFSKGKPATFNPIMIPTTAVGNIRNRGKEKQDGSYGVRKRDVFEVTTNTKKIHPNIFYYTPGGWGADKTTHTAPFPEKLVQDMILTWSNPGEIVYDPFMGSGTTAKVAQLFGRKWNRSEISPKYCEEARQRLSTIANYFPLC